MSNKKNKINNPLKGIPTNSLIITLVMILLCLTCGFGFGYCARGCVDQRENQAMTAYADASTVSSQDYTSFEFNMAASDTLSVFGFTFTFLNHSLPVYPDNSIPVFSVASLNPVLNVETFSLNWEIGSNVYTRVSYANILSQSSFNFGASVLNVSGSIASKTGYLRVGEVVGNLENDWELLYVRGFFQFDSVDENSFSASSVVHLRPVYSNGFSFGIVLDFSGFNVSVFPLDFFNYVIQSSSNFVFYNTSETGLTAEAYERGKLAGMADTEDLVREARLEGYNNGRAEGEDIGYQRGLDTSLEDISPFNVIVSGVNSFLRTEILPGVQLTIILSVAFGILLLGFAIKIFLGG